MVLQKTVIDRGPSAIHPWKDEHDHGTTADRLPLDERLYRSGEAQALSCARKRALDQADVADVTGQPVRHRRVSLRDLACASFGEHHRVREELEAEAADWFLDSLVESWEEALKQMRGASVLPEDEPDDFDESMLDFEAGSLPFYDHRTAFFTPEPPLVYSDDERDPQPAETWQERMIAAGHDYGIDPRLLVGLPALSSRGRHMAFYEPQDDEDDDLNARGFHITTRP